MRRIIPTSEELPSSAVQVLVDLAENRIAGIRKPGQPAILTGAGRFIVHEANHAYMALLTLLAAVQASYPEAANAFFATRPRRQYARSMFTPAQRRHVEDLVARLEGMSLSPQVREIRGRLANWASTDEPVPGKELAMWVAHCMANADRRRDRGGQSSGSMGGWQIREDGEPDVDGDIGGDLEWDDSLELIVDRDAARILALRQVRAWREVGSRRWTVEEVMWRVDGQWTTDAPEGHGHLQGSHPDARASDASPVAAQYAQAVIELIDLMVPLPADLADWLAVDPDEWFQPPPAGGPTDRRTSVAAAILAEVAQRPGAQPPADLRAPLEGYVVDRVPQSGEVMSASILGLIRWLAIGDIDVDE